MYATPNSILIHLSVLDCSRHYIIGGKLLDAQVSIENVKNNNNDDDDNINDDGDNNSIYYYTYHPNRSNNY